MFHVVRASSQHGGSRLLNFLMWWQLPQSKRSLTRRQKLPSLKAQRQKLQCHPALFCWSPSHWTSPVKAKENGPQPRMGGWQRLYACR